MITGIYKITCKESGQCYIGQSKNISRRWAAHYKRFSPDLFSYEVLIECPVESLNFLERAFISGYDCYHNGLNQTSGGQRWPHTESAGKKIGDAHRGKPKSEEQRAKMSAAAKGRVVPQEIRDKISATQKGRPYPEDQRQKNIESGIMFWKRRKGEV